MGKETPPSPEKKRKKNLRELCLLLGREAVGGELSTRT